MNHQSLLASSPLDLANLQSQFLMALEYSYSQLEFVMLFLQIYSYSLSAFSFQSKSSCLLSLSFSRLLFLFSSTFNSLSSYLFSVRSYWFFCQRVQNQSWKRSEHKKMSLGSLTELSTKQQKLKVSLAFLSGELLSAEMVQWSTLGYHQIIFKIVLPPSFLLLPYIKMTSMLRRGSVELMQNYVVELVWQSPWVILHLGPTRIVCFLFLIITNTSLSLSRRAISFRISTTFSIYYPSRKIKILKHAICHPPTHATRDQPARPSQKHPSHTCLALLRPAFIYKHIQQSPKNIAFQ